MDFQIGKTNFNGTVAQSGQWFNLEAGENYYRILPPVHSLAVEGKYGQFWAYHGGYKNSKGVTCHFQCIEEINRKTKLIQVRCPICDMVRERRAQYDLAKKQGKHTAEQLEEFFKKFIQPYQVQKKFFVNALNLNGEIGVLKLPYRVFTSLHALLQTLNQKQELDPTGYNGMYLKITKHQRFKGDRDTTYSIDLAVEKDPNNPNVLRYKTHELTPTIIEAMKKQTKDLAFLFKKLTTEQMALLAASTGDAQVQTVDKLFSKPEHASTEQESFLEYNIPGTTAKAVSQIELTPNGVSVRQPDAPRAVTSNSTVEANMDSTDIGFSAATAISAEVPINTVSSQSVNTTLTDEEFLAKFMSLKS